MNGPFISQPPFPFQVWPDMDYNQDSADRPEERLRSLTRSCFLLLLLGRLSLFALSFLLGTCLPSLLSPPFSLHVPALIPLSLAKTRLSPTLILFHLTIWCSRQMAPFLLLLAKGGLAYLLTALFVALRSLSSFQ